MLDGLIVKALSGFYYVLTDNGVIECKARGIFRKNDCSPLVGDRVQITPTDEGKGVVEQIAERKNALVRPPVANIDRLFVVVSTIEPLPNTVVIDKVIVNAEDVGIEPIVLINKCDKRTDEPLADIYRTAGFTTLCVSAGTGQGIQDIKPLISGSICAFAGNTGVGKSSILNAIDSTLTQKTAETSIKLGRGRHTTRHIELFNTCGGYIADTPGFSSFDMEQCDIIRRENLQFCFREFAPYITKCKFTSCSHTSEKGCAIIAALERGEIPKSRHESYVSFYREAEKIPNWQQK